MSYMSYPKELLTSQRRKMRRDENVFCLGPDLQYYEAHLALPLVSKSLAKTHCNMLPGRLDIRELLSDSSNRPRPIVELQFGTG